MLGLKAAGASTGSMKRKASDPVSNAKKQPDNGRSAKRVKMMDSRSILTQNEDAAFSKGELDLNAFLRSREFEIKALEDSMKRSKGSLTTRAFQQVPRDMRRRTASHNPRKTPKRLQSRARWEMREDNTSNVTPRKRKPGSTRGRLRAETAKRLGILAKKKAAPAKNHEIDDKKAGVIEGGGIVTRAARPKIRKNALNDPPTPKSKFRKRQIHKTWLPTHMWHVKRARLTEPKDPLWRFAIPITPSEKSYRPTHRAGGARGAVLWDMSYLSTIHLQGPMESMERVLRGVGIIEENMWESKGEKWRGGQRTWNGWLSREAHGERIQIAPATIIWSALQIRTPKKYSKRQLFVRIHPASFLEIWTELLRLSKLQRPPVQVEDLRFEIGSIEMTGPGSTETMLGILHPFDASDEHGVTLKSLAGVTNPASLPANSLLSFPILDPRLFYPPRSVTLPNTTNEDANFALLQMLSDWPVDNATPSSGLFDRDIRFTASRLPSQKNINRRKGQASPGSYPSAHDTDPPIPVMVFTSRNTLAPSAQATWTLLAPWKCILPLWYGLVHYPLTSGGNPRFGGLQELRQIHFEYGLPWFPADYPGTHAGFAWECDERQKRKKSWERRPKGKRIEWETLDLGGGRKGEHGMGWACDFERIIGLPDTQSKEQAIPQSPKDVLEVTDPSSPCRYLPRRRFEALVSSPKADLPPLNDIVTVRITLDNRGVTIPCARIYRLPSMPSTNVASSLPSDLRQQWLNLLAPPLSQKPAPNRKSAPKSDYHHLPLDSPLPQRVRLLAQSLLRDPPLPYPAPDKEDDNGGHPLVPDECDLVGFMTTGAFNLAEGKATGVGSVVVRKLVEGSRQTKKGEGRLCIVRNAGEKVGRLAKWEAV